MIQTTSISSDNCIELVVTYESEKTPFYYAEYDNPSTYVHEMIYVELIDVELVIGNKSIDVLSLLSDNQKEFIVNKITNA